MSPTQSRAAIFDGDDTLWSTEILYDQARDAVKAIVSSYGFDSELWDKRQRVLDVANVALHGFSPLRFPASCLQAFEEIRGKNPNRAAGGIEREISEAARSVFRRQPEVSRDAVYVLSTLKEKGIKLALLTKGDVAVQTDRIEHSLLGPFFDSITIVADKAVPTFAAIFKELNAIPRRSWVVGNSFRSDVLPGMSLGAQGILLQAHVWEYERLADGPSEDHRPIKISTLRDVARVVA